MRQARRMCLGLISRPSHIGPASSSTLGVSGCLSRSGVPQSGLVPNAPGPMPRLELPRSGLVFDAPGPVPSKIRHNKSKISETRSGTLQYEKLSDMITSEWITFWLFKIVYFTFFLLSTSAVVYTIACIYTAKEITFKKVISVVPKVWKRLMLTFLSTFAAFVAYNLITLVVIILCGITMGRNERISGKIIVFVIIAIFYLNGFVYLTLVWQLASIVTVLEDCYGFKAMKKSKELIKVVFNGWKLGSVDRTAYAILCFLLLSGLFLFGHVLQTVLYFMCKSYHHENIDKSTLADHLEAYLGEYVPLTAKEVQMEQYQV
ncbi:PREDICTED: uncharacterized protein LOC109358008 [Lupinus angustifolius]|uniref:uncharacterized protein LOC109358008 n=1 Tax=Lupinus angustifolius TaxID=3871 RepID=UPI00092FA7B6|nr:PREDICTED: uncharacterized protein LOC109358008 [Lupinus angustifolius]